MANLSVSLVDFNPPGEFQVRGPHPFASTVGKKAHKNFLQTVFCNFMRRKQS